MKINKKIRNATICKTDNITFKSKLEKNAYITLKELGVNPKYEPEQIILWEGFNPITPFYDEESKYTYERRIASGITGPKKLIQKNNKIIGIRYTCDIYFQYQGIDIWVELKSIENDVFYIKKKMFLKHLDEVYEKTGQKSMYFEVHSKHQLLQMLEIVKDYAERCNTETDG